MAIFSSNLPEALGGAVDMREKGHSKLFAIATWTVTGIVLGVALVAGNTGIWSQRFAVSIRVPLRGFGP